MTTKRKALACFTAQQVCLFGGLAVCIAIRPEGLGTNNGISYYGTFTDTFAFYSLGLLGSALFSFLTARIINQPDLWPLRQSLVAIAWLLIVITFTPYFISTFLDLMHTLAGIIMFIVQLILSIWLSIRLKWTGWVPVITALELIAGIISLIYVLPTRGFLIQGQIAFQLAFATLLAYGFIKLLPDSEA